MDERVLEIRKHLNKKLDLFRYEHTLGVSFTCQALAMRYGYDLDKAELAGLLHDCAKRYDNTALMEKCRKREIPITPAEEEDPSLLHAKLGAWIAKEKYGVEDEEILNAIRCHTTGRTGMTLLDKILYVADYIEPRRYKAANLMQMRKMAFIDLDEACFGIMDSILEYLKSQNCSIDEMTILACEDMRRVITEKIHSKHMDQSADWQIQQYHPEKCPENQVKYKEEQLFETVKGIGKNCSKRPVREKRRRYKNYRH